MNCYRIDGVLCAGEEELPFEKDRSGGVPEVWLFRRAKERSRAAFAPSDAYQLTAGEEDTEFLCAHSLPLPPNVRQALDAGRLRAVNLDWPGWRTRLRAGTPKQKKRVHIVAMGDVGGTMALGFRLLGGDAFSAVGICDVNEKAVARWELELNQVVDPWGPPMPPVEPVPAERVFDCNVLVFAATKGVPPLSQTAGDVRMAQLEANRGLVRLYAKKAREAGFRGLFAVVSDPVDPLAKAAFLASNEDETGVFDGRGLLPEQVQGFGLGVMNARAVYYAQKDPAFAQFLTEGRAFGPHGEELVIADSVARYDDARSRELTRLAVTANLKMRELGYKPYVAPALSSAALSILHAARGEWHYGSVYLGGAYFGCKNRFGSCGQQTEALTLPEELKARLAASWRSLKEIG